jgi:hypothetical protein
VALVRALGANSGMSEISGICADLDAEGGAFRTLYGTNPKFPPDELISLFTRGNVMRHDYT